MMDKDISKRTVIILLTLLMIFSLATAVFIGVRRNTIFVDEVWSYGLSNSVDGKCFFDWWENGELVQDTTRSIEDFFNHWMDGNFYREFVTVQKGEEFRYDIPYHYQELDVSPPLYYMLIHTICSFIPEQFSIWTGLVPNYIAFALSIPVLYLIAASLMKKKSDALAVTAFWTLSRAGLSDVNLIRMYMILTLLVLLSFLIHMKILEQKQKTVPLLIASFAVNTIGFLVHNYMYVIVFFEAAVTCIFLLYNRKLKQMFLSGITDLLSVGAAFLYFPAAVSQLTQSGYSPVGENSISRYPDFLKSFFRCVLGIDGEAAQVAGYVLAGLLLVVILPQAAIGLFSYLYETKRINFDKRSVDQLNSLNILFKSDGRSGLLKDIRTQMIICLTVVSFFSTFVLDMLGPHFALYRDRYFFIIFPLDFIVLFLCLCRFRDKISERFGSVKKIVKCIGAVLIIAIVFAANFWSRNYFLFHEKGQEDLRAMMKDQRCIVLDSYSPAFGVHDFAVYFMDADKIYCSSDYDERTKDEFKKNHDYYCWISIAYNKEEFENMLSADHEVEFKGLYFMSDDYYFTYYIK